GRRGHGRAVARRGVRPALGGSWGSGGWVGARGRFRPRMGDPGGVIRDDPHAIPAPRGESGGCGRRRSAGPQIRGGIPVRKTVTTTLAALSLLFVAACGSSGDGDEDAAPRRSTTTTEATSPGESTTTTEATSPGEPRPDDDPENNEICEGQTPVWAYAPSDREARAELVAAHPEGRARPAQTREECARREPELGTGDVQITLRWESDADLDLHVTEPNGTEIWYADKGPTATGGQ